MGDNKALNNWVILLSQSELPILKHTARELALLREDDNKLSAHEIASVINTRRKRWNWFRLSRRC